MDHIPRLSEVLYVGLCRKIGTPTEVAIRRDVMDMWEMIEKNKQIYTGTTYMFTGSYREGFRFDSSDMDVMFWNHSHKMISKVSQFSIYDTSKHTIILMEDTDTPPGFVILQLLTQPKDTYITSALVSLKGIGYLSNLLWRENNLQIIREYKGYHTVESHGPCSTGCHGNIEIDLAFCLKSIHWTKITSTWIERSLNYNWPPAFVLNEILKNGYHCVPIGNNILSPFYELEWRLSFSQAEQKLVCTMNHTQFLCYGLLKIFLKEVIKDSIDEPLLCSYHIKTTMFWIIQLETIQWCPNNLLNCFWKCFKYLVHCVYRGVFPNFFIPQNNMFLNKIIGSARGFLFEQLNQYYRMGVSCLLLSPTLRSILEPALRTPSFAVHFLEGHVKSDVEIDYHCRFEIFSLSFSNMTYQEMFTQLKSIERLLQFLFSPCQTLTLQCCTAQILIDMVFIAAHSSFCNTHKEMFALERTFCNILKLAGSIGCDSDLLYLALYYYRIGRYHGTIRLIHFIRKRLSQPFIFYNLRDEQRYKSVCRLSPSGRMKMARAKDLVLNVGVLYIPELLLEQQEAKNSGELSLFISPFLTLEWLSVLSYYRLGNRPQCQQSLSDLKTLLLYDDGRHIPTDHRDLAWQILGICQHLVGDLLGALQSYQESLKKEPCHRIQEATEARIKYTEMQLHRHIL
ncbi:uncharacterized protein LOC133190872 [Saccostrea echinata]|uniref:uncharacterized protein LOC133190872 n=1 Tax=Saccostrea echinata TaxID=191078 RepID=UPI002A7FA4B2|nr:uncharacterized protein LOC133190872 [Saccostrea echinata]